MCKNTVRRNSRRWLSVPDINRLHTKAANGVTERLTPLLAAIKGPVVSGSGTARTDRASTGSRGGGEGASEGSPLVKVLQLLIEKGANVDVVGTCSWEQCVLESDAVLGSRAAEAIALLMKHTKRDCRWVESRITWLLLQAQLADAIEQKLPQQVEALLQTTAISPKRWQVPHSI